MRVDYDPEGEGESGREWLRGLLSDLAGDGLVELEETGENEDDTGSGPTVRLRR